LEKVHVLSQETELLPVGKAAKKAGVSRQSLQYYLMVGLLEPSEVTETGRRLFDNKAVERVKLIKKLNDSGYPLRAIRELFMEGRTDMKGQQK
jgi:DNA-binding transcriptional MerR regulator